MGESKIYYQHIINYFCPYDEGQISLTLTISLPQEERIQTFEELCKIISSLDEGIEVNGFYHSYASKPEDVVYKKIIKVQSDGTKITPVFEEKAKARMSLSSLSSVKSITTNDIPMTLTDTVSEKIMTLSALSHFKEKCDGTYVSKSAFSLSADGKLTIDV